MHNNAFDPDVWRDSDQSPPFTQSGVEDARMVAARIADLVYAESYEWLISYAPEHGFFPDVGVEFVPAEAPGDSIEMTKPFERILVGFAKGSRGRRTMKTVMTAVLARIVERRDAVTAVIVVTNNWNSPDLERDHLRQVVAHMERGVAFVFLVVSPDGGSMSQIHIDPLRWKRGRR